MFKWLRNKLVRVSKEEFDKGLDRNTNFLEFAKAFTNNTSKVQNAIHLLETENMLLWTDGYSDESISRLLDIDMHCRRLFANVYGGSDLKYNKKFDPIDININKKKESTNSEAEELANDIYKKFHLTCDVLKNIKPKTDAKTLIELLSKKGVELDKGYKTRSTSLLRDFILDIGNNMFMPSISNEDHSYTDFSKFDFFVTGIKEYQGLNLQYNYEHHKRRISLVDLDKAFGLKHNAHRRPMGIGLKAEEIYDLLIKKGKWDDKRKSI